MECLFLENLSVAFATLPVGYGLADTLEHVAILKVGFGGRSDQAELPRYGTNDESLLGSLELYSVLLDCPRQTNKKSGTIQETLDGVIS